MYIIFSHRARKSLRIWSHLQPTPANTAFVRQVREEMAPQYPDDELVVMHSAASIGAAS